VYTNEDIEKMVQEKQKLKSKPLSISKQRAQLIALKQSAKDEGNMTLQKELKNDLRSLREMENEENARMFSWHKGNKISLAAINKRNKASNMVKVVEQKLQTESSETDPFSRRPTKPSIVATVMVKPLPSSEDKATTTWGEEEKAHKHTQKEENGKGKEQEKEREKENEKEKKKEKEKEKEKEAPDKEDKWQDSAENEQDSDLIHTTDVHVGDKVCKAHDELQFEIDIDLTAAGQQKPRGLPKVASQGAGESRKRPAPLVDKTKTLSVLDYKRRRGLI